VELGEGVAGERGISSLNDSIKLATDLVDRVFRSL
jgi:hypothetical protein